MSLQAGQIVADKYRIVRMLGQGGMGEVYEGDNLRIHRRVAIKTLLAGVSSRGDVVQRFEREAQAAGRIGSEHIVEVLDMGDLPDGSRYMVMEFLEGTTLSDRIVARGRVPSREAARIVMELCEGLQAAHDAQIIHRDLKPANIFLLSAKQGRPDFVKILDFGVSKFSVLGDEMSMTRTGAVVGTPYYMSPEQAKGAKFIDARSDLYSVGVILYETITGQVPFNAQTFNELIFKIALEAPPPPESFVPDLDPHFASIVRKAMARDANERFQTAAEFRQALEAWAAAFDRASASGVGGGFQQGSSMMRGGGTQMLGPGAFASPPAPAAQHGQNGNSYAQAPQFQPGQSGQQAVGPSGPQGYPAAPAIPTAPQKSNAGLAFVIALLVVLVAGGATVFFVMLRHGKAAEPVASASASSSPASTTTAASVATSAPSVTPPAAPTSSAMSVSLLPNASASASATEPPAAPSGTPSVPSGHWPPNQGHVAQTPSAKPEVVAAPTSQPTAKPTSGRSITGDL